MEVEMTFLDFRTIARMMERSGTWTLSSRSDPRWNCAGDVERLVITEGMHPDTQAKIEELKKTLGDPPDDLHYSAWKD